MPLAAATSSLALATSPVAAAAASTAPGAAAAAAAAPLASWMARVAGSRGWVGSAWILSSAVLTTYSTTTFLKYEGGGGGGGEEGPSAKTASAATLASHPREEGGARTLRQFRSILNSTPRGGRRPEEEEDGRGTTAAVVAAGREPPGASVSSAVAKNLSRASLLTLHRFSGSLLLGLLAHSRFYDLTKLPARFLGTVRAAKLFLLPSLFLFVANYTNSIALERIGISLTYTSKCGIPLVTVLLTFLLDGRSSLPSAFTLLSLLPIAVGIGAASWNSPTFEPWGFLAAVASTTSQAGLNVASKRVMRTTGIRGADAQRAMVFVALGIGLAMTAASIVRDAGTVTTTTTATADGDGDGVGDGAGEDSVLPPPAAAAADVVVPHPPPWLTSLAVASYHIEYVLSFTFVSLVEPITYGTCDALRRLLIIVVGNRMFRGDRFTKTNLAGIGTALAGALMYSIASSGGGGGATMTGPGAKP